MPSPDRTTVTITVGDGGQYARLAAMCRAADEVHRLGGAELRELDEQFRASVHPKVWEALMASCEGRNNQADRWQDLLIAEMLRHLPGLAPALELVWQHVREMAPKDVGRCCVDDVADEGLPPDGAS